MVFYAVANGRNIGIFTNWIECSQSVKGYKNSVYKKFDTMEEADMFIQSSSNKEMEIEMETKSVSVMNCDFIPDYYVYTDGSCSNNGKNNAKAGIGIFFGIDDMRNVSKKVEGKQTNNVAEISAIIEAYSIIENDLLNGKKVVIATDSEYSIKCVSSYGEKCHKKNWDVDIPNKDLVKTAYELYKDNQTNIRFLHIRAHTNNTDIHSIGNDHADKLANMAVV
jgi:ribonuclease HI